MGLRRPRNGTDQPAPAKAKVVALIDDEIADWLGKLACRRGMSRQALVAEILAKAHREEA